MQSYILYGSDGCHLCEIAHELCERLINHNHLKLVDIVDDEHLVEAFGVHIPVLENINTNAKLFWPFDEQKLVNFITD